MSTCLEDNVHVFSGRPRSLVCRWSDGTLRDLQDPQRPAVCFVSPQLTAAQTTSTGVSVVSSPIRTWSRLRT